MTQEEIIQAISDDKMMPFIQPEQLAQIVEFVIKNYRPFLPSNLDEIAIPELEMTEWMKYGPHTNYPWCSVPDAIKITAERFFTLGKQIGAEWMAGQGITEMSRLYRDPNPPHEGLFFGVLPFFCTVQMALNYQDGEEVIVQIRKK